MTATCTAPALPDLAQYTLHRVIENIDPCGDGRRVPGLRATFHRRLGESGRLESVGRYVLGGREVFVAWGFVGDADCAFHAVRLPDGSWDTTKHGCPAVDVIDDQDNRAVGLRIQASTGPVIFLADPTRRRGRHRPQQSARPARPAPAPPVSSVVLSVRHARSVRQSG